MTWLFQLHDVTQKAHNDKCENWKRIHNAVEDVIVAISTYSLVLGEPTSWSTGVTPPPPQQQDKLTRYYLVLWDTNILGLRLNIYIFSSGRL